MSANLHQGGVATDPTDDLPFPSITRCRRFVCTQCGGRTVNVSPDWRAHNAVGNGVQPLE